MISSKIFPLFILASTVLAMGQSDWANPPQSHRVKRFTIVKRQDSSRVRVGASCASITGNPDDVVCDISGQDVSCAPVCCTRDGEFVDGCPAGDQCVFETGTLKCCPEGGNCGTRPTACVDFAAAPARNGRAVCPSATPICITRENGGIACTGNTSATNSIRNTGLTSGDNAPRTTRATITAEYETPASTTVTDGESMTKTYSTSGNDIMETGTPSGVDMRSTAAVSFSASETMTLADDATPTDGTSPTGSSSSSANSAFEGDLIFGLVVAVITTFAIFI